LQFKLCQDGFIFAVKDKFILAYTLFSDIVNKALKFKFYKELDSGGMKNA